jgi:hypothetical protein
MPESAPSQPATSASTQGTLAPPAGVQIGFLTEAQKQRAVSWLVEKWGKGNPTGLPVCEMCKVPGMTWGVGDHIIAPLVVSDSSLNLGGAIYPVISIVCSNCGNTHYVNAILMKLLVKGEDGVLTVPPELREVKNA